MSSSHRALPPLMQNSHDDGSPAALRVLFLSFCMWEATYRIFGYLISTSLDRYPRMILDPSLFLIDDDDNDRRKEGIGGDGGDGDGDGNAAAPRGSDRSEEEEDARRVLVELGPSYAVSLVHSIYATCRGIMHLVHLWDASAYDKFVIPGVNGEMEEETQQTDAAPSSCRWAHLLVAETNTLFLSYLLYDLCHVLHRYPRLGGTDTVVHHVLFAVCAAINGTYGLLAFAFGWLAVGEASTIFLNLRWFAIKSGRGHRPILETINVLFAIVFFYSRIGVYTAGVVHLFFVHGRSVLFVLPERTGVPTSLLVLTCGCVILGWVLNLLWGFKILAMVGRRRGKGMEDKRKRQ